MTRPADETPPPDETPAADPELVAAIRSAYGWDGVDLTVTAGPRGALGQIWQVRVGPDRYAVKESFAARVSPEHLALEVDLTTRARAAGVGLPASHPDRAGDHQPPGPRGTWLRRYDWVDLHRVDPADPATPARLGTLLARLHGCGPAAATESDGSAPDWWYDHVPADERFDRARASGAPWAAVLTDRLRDVAALTAGLAPADPATMIVCHRDLHPENVWADAAGDLVVVDWDNLGPAVPGRELVRVAFDWFADRDRVDLAAVDALGSAYAAAGGPGRVHGPADATLVVASRLNFLLAQTGVALDDTAEPRHRTWAEREIDEALAILPTPAQLAEVVRRLAAQASTPPQFACM